MNQQQQIILANSSLHCSVPTIYLMQCGCHSFLIHALVVRINILYWGGAYFVGENLHWQEDHGGLEQCCLVKHQKKNPLPCSPVFHATLPYFLHEMLTLSTQEDEIQRVVNKLKREARQNQKSGTSELEFPVKRGE